MWEIKVWLPPVHDEDGSIVQAGAWQRIASSVETEEEAEKIVRKTGKDGVVVVAKSSDGEISYYPASRSFSKLKWLK